MEWENIRVLVTGGASFIGSHLSERLVHLGANLRIADNLSSGKLSNIENIRIKIEFFEGPDLLDKEIARIKEFDWLVFTSVNGVVFFFGVEM